MTNAIADQNHIRTKLAVLNTDTVQGTNLVNIAIDETTGGMKITNNSSISFTMQPISPQDENYVNVLMWEGTDGNIYPWVATSSGNVLISE